MYCSSCGVAVAQGVSYCNHCGAKLTATKADGVNKPSELFPESLVWAIVTVFVVGLGAIIGLMAVMKEVVGVNAGMILAVTLLSFLLMLAIEGVLIWLLLRRKSATEEIGDTALSKDQATKGLDAAQARSLTEPVASVTEHTTRAFEPIYIERKAE